MNLRLLAVGALSCALAGCNTVATVLTSSGPNPVTPQRVYELRLAYDAAETLAIAYVRRPLCGQAKSPPLCSNATVSAKLKAAGPNARAALNALTAFAHDHPTLDASAYYDAAVTAVAVVQSLVTQ